MQRNDIPTLQDAIRALHQCDSVHVKSVPVREMLQGKVAWEGTVEIFDLPGCAAASRAYGWNYRDGSEVKSTIVLDLPPVNSARTAVQVTITSKTRQ